MSNQDPDIYDGGEAGYTPLYPPGQEPISSDDPNLEELIADR